MGPIAAPAHWFGDYEVIDELAAGGCGVVYRARHRLLGRAVAIKVLHDDLLGSPEMRERLVREARALCELRHPNIVEVYDLGQLPDGRPYYVMELLEGEDLETRLLTRGRLTIQETRRILGPLCDALENVHQRGIVHRDLKASNIFLAAGHGGVTVKLLDFGIAKWLGGSSRDTGRDLTGVSARLGTPTAMAPEQISGSGVDARTDVYALGVLTYQLLTGMPPFEGADRDETERMHLELPPPSLAPHAPAARQLDDALAAALAKMPEHRPGSAAEFLRRFDLALPSAAACSISPAAVAPAGPAFSCPAGIAILVRARLEALPADDAETVDRVARALDLAEDRLHAHGLRPRQVAPSMLLAGCELPAELEAARRLDRRTRLLAAFVEAAVQALAPGWMEVVVRVGRLESLDDVGEPARGLGYFSPAFQSSR